VPRFNTQFATITNNPDLHATNGKDDKEVAEVLRMTADLAQQPRIL